jgi:CTP synthase (UTP-ammonia lyase)
VKPTIRVALVGDRNPAVTAHCAIPIALDLAAKACSCSIEAIWMHTASLVDPPAQLRGFGGCWCVPASPYANATGALAAIKIARERRLPFLGTCAGFQHAIIEYARYVRSMPEADHAEDNPASKMPIISELSCSLVEATQEITTMSGSRIREAYGTETICEQYRCRYGLNRNLQFMLLDDDLWFTAHDENGEVRAVELRSRPFFVATLFQPERRALNHEAPPLVVAFVEAMVRYGVAERQRAVI